MSTAPAEVTPDSASPHESGSLPETRRDHAPRPTPSRMRVVLIAAAIVAAAILLILVRGRTRTTAPLSTATRTNPDQVLRLKGTTEAVEARAILAPLLESQQVPTLTIIHLAPAGKRVKQGDLLV